MSGTMLSARDMAENKAESCPSGKAQKICEKTNETSDKGKCFGREQNRNVIMTEKTTEWGSQGWPFWRAETNKKQSAV